MKDTIKELDGIQDALRDISDALMATDSSDDEEQDLLDDSWNCIVEAMDYIGDAIDYLKEAEKLKEGKE